MEVLKVVFVILKYEANFVVIFLNFFAILPAVYKKADTITIMQQVVISL